MPKTKIAENTAPKIYDILPARYKTGISRPAMSLPFSIIAVLIIAIDATRTVPPKTAPYLSSFFADADAPTLVKYAEPGKKFSPKYSIPLSNQCGDDR